MSANEWAWFIVFITPFLCGLLIVMNAIDDGGKR